MNTSLLLLASTLLISDAAASTSPYIGEQDRAIKALSATDTAGYLAGKGMGLARAAELNRYPGPRHALDLATELQLTPEQTKRLGAAFNTMDTAARSLGRELVDREVELDSLFSTGRATEAQVFALTAEIGRLQGLIRAAHLNAHITTQAALTPAQVARYIQLRGYTSAATGTGHGSHRSHD